MLSRTLFPALLLTMSCATPRAHVAPVPLEPIRITLVGTNDLHGWVQPHTTVRKDGTVLEEGGAAALAGYVAILRADNPGGVVLLDSGDMFQGTLVSNLTEGEVVIDALNLLGYAAAAVGNHDFDYGPVGPQAVASSPAQDPFGALKARIRQARFPFLAANIARVGGGRPEWLSGDGTLSIDVKGVKIGIVGLATPATRTTTNPVNVATLEFGPLVESAIAAAGRLRAAGAELVVGVVHAGGACRSIADPRDLSSCDPTDGELFPMIEALPQGTLDAVITGHTHQPIGHFIRGVPVIETSGLGRSFGYIELFVDPATRAVLPSRTAIHAAIPICARVDAKKGDCDMRRLADAEQVELVPATFLGRPVQRDAALDGIVTAAVRRVEELQQRKIGVVVKAPLRREHDAESALGDLLADSLREMERADVALMNSGGIRADVKAGDLTYGDVYEVLPFDNTVATITLTGDELTNLVGLAYGGRKGLFQESGLTVQLQKCGDKATLHSFALADGSPVDPRRQYRLVLPDFLARGNEGLAAQLSKLPSERVDLGDARPLNLRDALVDHWQHRHPELVPPALGRIQIVPCTR